MINKQHITIFGATGKIGGELLCLLSQAGIPAIAVTRNIDKAISMPSVIWMQADMGNKESLYATMDDSKAVFLASGMSETFVQAQHNVIKVAKAQGVGHIVKLSSGAADKNATSHIARAHGEVEELLKASGIAATILRPTGFMQNWLGELALSVKTEHKIYEATGDGKRAYIDMRDIAAVAYTIILTLEKHTCHTYFLTGDEAVNYTQIAETISNVIGAHVAYVSLSAAEAAQRMAKSGKPDWVIKTLLSYSAEQRDGKTATVSTDVRDILGKPARTIAAFVKEYAAHFK